ncbi:MAG: tRNA 2-thiouridine(34) synthase MnmA [Bdellovibrionota bacterium]
MSYQDSQTASEGRVVVAMSGGVDSCASALLLAEQGYSIIGVAMQVWDYRKNGGNSKRATCCAPSDFDDARQIADSLSFPFYVFDFEDSFYEAVIRPFVSSYLAGKTPNPCLDCNRKVKFHELRERARAFGAAKVATGHYARIREKPDGSFGLYTSRDLQKDQSYFLYALTQDDLRTTLFPVGDMTKTEVRQYLGAHGFDIASKAESQDICFVSGTVSEFIAKESNTELQPGKFVSTNGDVLGEHEGVHSFTVGQRRGLGLSDKMPLYVVDIDPEQRQVTVGPKEDLERSSFHVAGVNWVGGATPTRPIRSRVKLRYRHPGVLCEVTPADGDSAIVRFLDEWTPVSPGQAAVFYSEHDEVDGAVEVLGGGRIVKDPAHVS